MKLRARAVAWVLGAVTVLAAEAATSSETLAEAWREVEFLNFDRAIALFESQDTGSSPQAREARIGLALALHYRQPDRESDKRRAAEIYDALIAEIDGAPSDPSDRLAVYLRARMLAGVNFPGDRSDTAHAAALFERLINPDTEDVFAELAASHLATLAFAEGTTESAERGVRMLRERLAAQPDHLLAGVQWMQVGNALRYPLNDDSAAMDAYERALDARLPAENLIPSVHWRIARLAESAGRTEIARTHYEALAREHGRSLFAHESERALERLAPSENSAESQEIEP